MLVIEHTYADGHPERLPGLASVLARVPYDLVVVSGSDAVEAARAAIQSIPIVAISSTLGMGGSSLARSEGNLSGIALLFDEVANKWLELLVETVPVAQRIGVLFDPSPSDALQLRAIGATAEKLGKTLLPLRIDNVDMIRNALERARSEKLDGLVFLSSPIFTANAARVVELAQPIALPAIYEARVLAARGGLMSYGPDLNEAFRRAASYADRILKGAKPGDLPDRAADPVRAGDQPQDRQGARPRSAADAARPRRRGDRVIGRREFITLLGGAAAAWPLAARAQTKRARIGWFTVAPHPYIEGFRRGLKELGWIEGENVVIEHTYADGHPERLPGLASVLARVPYDLVVVSGSDAVEAARAAIQSIPIVAISSTLGMGGSSLARSEGNLSGIALLFDEVANKWLELLVETVPVAQRIGVLFDPSPSDALQLRAIGATAEKLGKTLLPLRIDNVDMIRNALERARSEKLDGLVFLSSPIFTANAARVVELAQPIALPAIYEARVLAARGGLMSYGPDLNEAFRRAASYADRILKGAKPGDLPVERPTKFELVINLKTAKALGLEVPPTLLARADEVIE